MVISPGNQRRVYRPMPSDSLLAAMNNGKAFQC
ncbi:hypothetical protein B23_2390 [Geobacillus thermoleovorans B23]|nr:hypothetical protein B23_2390 [Geobacillus thermoleovorans B23]